MHELRTANLLGAAALTIADRLRDSAAAAAGTSASGTAALITLVGYPGLGVTELGARVGLSQPAAARMIDGLVALGLVERRAGSTGRSVAIHPTRRGRAAAERALRAREGELTSAIERLPADERAALTRALERVLYGLFDRPGSEHVVCRLCDRGACLSAGQACPVGQAARDRGGAHG
ncbi:MAG TPA: MarR family winged helix-turn-helix transcriptional regulator [Streptosporangiaceae bacterium]|jgi:DNA-binding MarR family transcriptional regulator